MRNSARRRVVRGLGAMGAAFVALGIVVSSGSPALATSDPTDCFPGLGGVTNPSLSTCYQHNATYKSKDNGASAKGRITWENGRGYVDIEAYVSDDAPDGKEPRLVAYYWDGSNTEKKMVFHSAGGELQTKSFSTASSIGPTDNDVIYFAMCNGGTDASPAACSDVSGQFHRY